MLTAQKASEVRHELLGRLLEARTRTDELFALVKDDALYRRPIAERHRVVFYIGHLEAFDWNLLHARLLGVEAFHPEFDRLFAFGIDPVGGGLPDDAPEDWPSLEEVHGYVQRVRAKLDEKLDQALSSNDAREFSGEQLLNVAIEHRLMHAETLTYMLHQMSLEHLHRKPARPQLVVSPSTPQMKEIPAGEITLGLSYTETDKFGWDNEYEAHTVQVPGFDIDKYKVTNGEYKEFVAAGGYENGDLWTEEGWQWRTENNITHPAFWKPHGDHWHYRTLFDEVPLPAESPVYVSQAEASAYARWAGKSLPTEAQWHRAAYGTAEGEERPYPWGTEPPNAKLGNFDFHHWDPTPVSAFPQGESAFGVADLLGNGWEWTSSVFGPFPGFQAFSFYPGYSANFFDGKHYVLKGGSARTAASMLRRSFRNWFQGQYQYVYAGFRCVSDSASNEG
jgi:gamma-glutamyl hercynylcysteine S-oxide synthase